MDAKRREYTVEGRWPFPLDMLRTDSARAASPADQAVIDRLSNESLPDLSLPNLVSTVRLVLGEGLRFPNAARWESFGWKVKDFHKLALMPRRSPSYDELLQQRDELVEALREMLRRFGGAGDKPTPAEVQANAAIAKATGGANHG